MPSILKTSFVLLTLIGAACSPAAPPEPEYASIEEGVYAYVAEQEGRSVDEVRQEHIDYKRTLAGARVDQRNDPSLNWVSAGISTGKFSESIDSSVHRSYAECAQAFTGSASTCFPIAALPASYWNAETPPPQAKGD